MAWMEITKCRVRGPSKPLLCYIIRHPGFSDISFKFITNAVQGVCAQKTICLKEEYKNA